MWRQSYLLLAVAIVSYLPVIFGVTTSQSSMSGSSGSSSSNYNVQTESNTVNGHHTNTVSITGNGIAEHLKFQDPSPMSLSVNTFDSCLIIADQNRADFLVFSDRPRTLVIMRDGECTQKTYKTSGGGTTSTSQRLSDPECREIRKRASEQLKKHRIYWDKWSKDFEQNMKDTFYPGFPFGNQHTSNPGASMFPGSMFSEFSGGMSMPANIMSGLPKFGKKK